MFLKNAWYVGAWDHEITDGLTPVVLLGERIVLFRTSDGSMAALQDVCPHRKLPLSMGRLRGDHVECGYHGLTFDARGRCTRAPTAHKIPANAAVRRYPVASRYGLVWIWMGDEARADEGTIVEVEHWGDPRWGMNRGESMSLDCNYLHVTDNLLDPSHVAWVHETSFGNTACEEGPMEVSVSETGVVVSRWMLDVEVAPFYAQFVRFDGRCDRQQHYEVRYPCHAVIKAIFTRAGTGGAGRRLPDDAFVMDSYNFLTPVDAVRTKYYWFQMRNFAPGDATVSDQFDRSVRAAFAEDRAILNAVEQGGCYDPVPRVWLPVDEGPSRFRRRMQQMINAEQ